MRPPPTHTHTRTHTRTHTQPLPLSPSLFVVVHTDSLLFILHLMSSSSMYCYLYPSLDVILSLYCYLPHAHHVSSNLYCLYICCLVVFSRFVDISVVCWVLLYDGCLASHRDRSTSRKRQCPSSHSIFIFLNIHLGMYFVIIFSIPLIVNVFVSKSVLT